MANTTQKSVILIFVFIISCAAIILMAVSLATKYWLTERTGIQSPPFDNSSPNPGGSTSEYTEEFTWPTEPSTATTTTKTTIASTTTEFAESTSTDKQTTNSESSITAVSSTAPTVPTIVTAEPATSTVTVPTIVTAEPATSTVTVSTTDIDQLATATSTVATGDEFTAKLNRSSRDVLVARLSKIGYAGPATGLTETTAGGATTGKTTAPLTNFYIDVNMGLFNGHVYKFYIVSTDCDFGVASHCVMNMGLWVVAVIFYLVAIVFGVVSAVFAAINATMTPIEEITGMTGLYVWNGLAALFSLAGILCYVGLHVGDLGSITFKDNLVCSGDSQALTLEPGSSSFGYSFYLTIGVMALYVVNLGLIFLTTRSLGSDKDRYTDDDDDKNQGVIMLF